jgi:ssDNA-specific exonuclease RecJ
MGAGRKQMSKFLNIFFGGSFLSADNKLGTININKKKKKKKLENINLCMSWNPMKKF